MSIVESSNMETEQLANIDLAPIRKKRFSIDGDNSRVLELNTTDMGVIDRLRNLTPKLDELTRKYVGLKIQLDENGGLTDESMNELADTIKDLDKQVRDYIDELFDSNVSELMAPSGTMFDMINGTFRFEYIVETLSNLYADEIKANMEKREKAVSRHTAKYTKSRSKKK